MSITIESPTAEAVLEALKQLPAVEVDRLKWLLDHREVTPVDESTEWSDEDLQDLDRSTGMLILERFGPEEGDYG